MKTMTGVPCNLITEDNQDEGSLSSANTKVGKTSKTSERVNDLGPYGDDSSTPSDSPSDSDSDSSVPASDDDQIDLELLRGLEAIHIAGAGQRTEQESAGQLVPKGPQRSHKVRKQGKSATVPYAQGCASVPRHGGGASLPPYPVSGGVGPPHYQGSEDRGVDMVLSESLNDPGFRDNLYYTLQAQADQYPTLVTPPLSSSDCSYSADYTNSGYSSGSSVSGGGSGCHSNAYYAQYTPESLLTASPHGSDASIEDEPYATASTSATGESSFTPYYHSREGAVVPRSSSAGSASVASSHWSGQSDESKPRSSSAGSASVASSHWSGQSDESKPRSSPAGSASVASSHWSAPSDESKPRSSPAGSASVASSHWSAASDESKPLCDAEKFIDNMCVGVKYFLSAHKRHPGERGEAYAISEDRAHSLLTLARVIQARLDSLKEAEKLMAEVNAATQCREEGYNAARGTVYEYL